MLPHADASLPEVHRTVAVPHGALQLGTALRHPRGDDAAHREAHHARLAAEGKPGATMRSGSSYSTWWNGVLRTTAYFHNMIGILTETIGNPTPQTIPFIPARQLRFADYTYPLEPFQEWHFRQSIDYSVTANKAILDLAARNRDGYLYNIWRMGRDMIDRGSKDDWIVTPKLVADAEAKLGGGGRGRGGAPLDAFSAAGFGGRQGPPWSHDYPTFILAAAVWGIGSGISGPAPAAYLADLVGVGILHLDDDLWVDLANAIRGSSWR